ncbi:MAG: hypothetical protein IKM22_00035 [Clostridia bacterium]|nr:hypothetical protein [Clostridia bacterium]
MKNTKKTALFNIILAFLLVASLALSVAGCEKNTNDTSEDVSGDVSNTVSNTVSNDSSLDVSKDVSSESSDSGNSGVVLTAEEHYNLAKELINEEKYEEAYNHLLECKDYADTNEILKKFVLKYQDVSIYNENEKFIGRYEYKYNKNGNLVSEIRYENEKTDSSENDRYAYKVEYAYDDAGNRTLVKIFAADKTVSSQQEYTYDKHGNVLVEITYDEYGNKYQEENKYTYDKTGEKIICVEVYGDGILISKDTYDETGEKHLSNETYSDGKLMSRWVRTYSDDGKTSTYASYDGEGDFITTGQSVYDEYGNATSDIYCETDGFIHSFSCEYTYDEKGNKLIQKDYYDGELTYIYEYDENGNRVAVIEYNFEENAKSRTEYNKFGEQMQHIKYDKDGNIVSTQKNSYDEYRNLITSGVYDKDGKVIDENRFVNENVCVLYFPDGIEE